MYMKKKMKIKIKMKQKNILFKKQKLIRKNQLEYTLIHHYLELQIYNKLHLQNLKLKMKIQMKM